MTSLRNRGGRDGTCRTTRGTSADVHLRHVGPAVHPEGLAGHVPKQEQRSDDVVRYRNPPHRRQRLERIDIDVGSCVFIGPPGAAPKKGAGHEGGPEIAVSW